MPETRSWALITGASSGIGRALAIEFAARGFHLVLTGRDRSALDSLSDQCSAGHSVEATIVVADLCERSGVDAVIDAIRDLPVELLVNNAGFGVKGNFVDNKLDDELRMIDLQVSTMLHLTKAVLPGMVARGQGRILNIASVYSVAPVPRQAVYSAGKSFLINFSAGLSEELRGTGVTVTVCLPGVTRTEFRSRAGIADRGASGMRAEAVARIAAVATMRGRRLVTPGFANRLFVTMARHLRPWATARLVRFINDRRGVNR